MIHIEWLFLIIGLVAGVVLALLGAWQYNIRGLNERSKSLDELTVRRQEEAEKLLSDAERNGEQRKRELLLEAKAEIHESRLELDKQVRERKAELSKDRSRIDQKEEALDLKVSAQEASEKKAQEQFKLSEEKLKHAEEVEAQKIEELQRISSLTLEEARGQVMDVAQKTYRHDIATMVRQMEEEAKDKVELYSRDLVISTIQRYASEYVSESTVSVVALPNDEMKGRIIGREGRNIRALETLTGVDIIIDDTPEAVVLSSFDPIRREIARIALEKLIQDGRIHPARIEEMVGKAKKELDQAVREHGEKACYDTGVLGLTPELVKTLGRLHYRTSYGQNALQHSVEVSWLAGMMAGELGLDTDLAKRAGLLHDIGKAVDFEQEGTHVQLGANLARKFNEDPVVLNAIVSHHGDAEANSPISCLVQAADTLSAARPGARRENMETYIKRIERLEEIANEHEGVEKCYAIQAGREIRVMVMPDKVSDDEMIVLAHDISRQIENELNYPGQIKVNVIRETRVSDMAK